MRRRHALIASTLAVAVLLVGCGSDDDSSDDGGDTTEETTTTADEATEESTESTETTEATTEDTDVTQETSVPDPDDTTPDESVPPAEDIDAFCVAYDEFDATASALPDETLEDIRAGATTLRQGLEAVRGVAPADVADGVDTLIAAFTQLEQIAAEVATVEEAQSAFAEAFTAEDAQNAAEGLDAFFNENCPQANDEQAPAEGE